MGFAPLAPWAVRSESTRGRLHPEPEAPTRSPWQRDRDRIIHSSAFRKLQYKTQVFVNHEGDFYRTRLTHSIEVAQIARSVARALGLDEDLAEALALAHDLGHPPFGHAGEEALSLAMKPFGGFDHNAQSLRIVTLLESRYASFDGLNLTWETLEGLVKHNGPLRNPPGYIADYNERQKLDLGTHASAEAQVASVADDIAYHSHDLDDGMRARLFGPDDLAHLPVVGKVVRPEQPRPHPVVQIVAVIGDVVRHRRDLRLGARVRAEIELLPLVVVGDVARRVAQRAIVLDQPLQRLPGQVEPVEAGVAALQQGHDAQRLRVVVEPAERLHRQAQRLLPRMAERRVAQIVRQRQRLGQVLVQPQRAGDRAGDLRHLD